MSVDTIEGRARTLTIWAGGLLAAIAALHVIFYKAVAWHYLDDWLGGALWASRSTDAPIAQAEAHFWPQLGSFAVPMLLLGLVIARLARRGSRCPGSWCGRSPRRC